MAMHLEMNDLFSVSPPSQPIEKRYSCTSLTWKIALVQHRVENGTKEIRSPIFHFSNRSWELIVCFCLYPRNHDYHINSIKLICVATISSSINRIYLGHGSISDQTEKILHKIPDVNYAICMCKSSSHEILRDATGHVIPISLSRVVSLTISLNLFSEENTKQVVLSSEVVKDEKRGPLLIYDSKLSSDFEELYENRQLSDVILKLGEQEFPAHKSVLSARSKVFAAMFEHDMKENRQGTVDLVQMEADTVQDMLRYIYCAKVRELSSTEALNLYVAADRYDLKELRNICRDVVVRDISIDNVFDIAAVADIHDDELLIRELKPFMARNGKDIIKTEKWKVLSTKNPVLGMKIFEWLFSEQ